MVPTRLLKKHQLGRYIFTETEIHGYSPMYVMAKIEKANDTGKFPYLQSEFEAKENQKRTTDKTRHVHLPRIAHLRAIFGIITIRHCASQQRLACSHSRRRQAAFRSVYVVHPTSIRPVLLTRMVCLCVEPSIFAAFSWVLAAFLLIMFFSKRTFLNSK